MSAKKRRICTEVLGGYKCIIAMKLGSRWCHRIFPIQATCRLDEKEELKALMTFQFAVGYNRRGIEETQMKDVRVTPNGSKISVLLDRGKCFSIVAAAVKDGVPDSIVDLKCCELAVLLEVLPHSGIPNECGGWCVSSSTNAC
ncbi:uncharacterized protein [Coffea arabica]|uniref:Uncharacterized protein isoform X3 n=1 Tax=Coffea arabica TaxID=13443 RepID=A0ABM4WA73_COFAR